MNLKLHTDKGYTFLSNKYPPDSYDLRVFETSDMGPDCLSKPQKGNAIHGLAMRANSLFPHETF